MSASYDSIMESIELREEHADEGPDRDGETVEQGQIGTVASAYKRFHKPRTDRDVLPEELCEIRHELPVQPKSMSTSSAIS